MPDFAACVIVSVKGPPEGAAFGFGIKGRQKNPLVMDTVPGADRIALTNKRSSSAQPLSIKFLCISIKLGVIGVAGTAPKVQ